MATSGKITLYVTNYNNLIFEWSRKSVSEANNTSTISWQLSLTSGDYGAISSSVQKNWSVQIDGKSYSGKNSIAIGNSTTKVLANGTTTIQHAISGAKTFTIKFSQEFGITFAGTYIGTKSKEASATLDPIKQRATIISAANFNDEGNPSFTYTPPIQEIKQLLCNVSWGGVAYISNREIPTTGSAFTFALTDEERQTLRNAMASANSKTVTYTLVTVFNDGTTLTSAKDATAFITNALPSAQITIVDVDESTTMLTGNSSVFVRYASNAKATAVATAKKGATIVSVVWKNGTKTQTGESVTFVNVESGNFVCEVTDSRGNKATITSNKTLIEYVRPTCNLDNAEAGAGGTITFGVSGDFFNGSFGAASNYVRIAYRIYEKGTTPTNYAWVTPTYSGNTFSAFVNVEGLDYQKTYTLDVYAQDAIFATQDATKDVNVLPLFDWGKDDFQFNVPVNFGAGALLEGNTIKAGSWTPTLSNDAAVTSYEERLGWYQKVGNVVTIGWQIKATIKSGYQAVGLSISGAPFAPHISAFGGGIAYNIYIAANMCFAGWAISHLGLINARLQPCNNTTAGNLNISSTSGYPTGGGQVTLAGTICYTIDE